LIDGLVAEVKVPSVTIVGNAIPLNPIAKPLELPTTSLVLALSLHLAGLLVNQKPLPQTPCLLPDVAQPTEELIDLEVGAFVFWWRSHQWVLAAKEVSEGTVLLLIARANGRRNLVVAVRWLL
jgi:hypothetical protein